MSRIRIVFILLCITITGHAQQSAASKLVTLLHQESVAVRLEMIRQFNHQATENSQTDKDSLQMAQELYTKIETVYQKQFSSKELNELYAFYSSPLGTKLLTQQDQRQVEISSLALQWELEQQGLSIADFEALPDAAENDEFIAASTQNAVDEVPPPIITNLEDLKALIRENPIIINDQKVMMALFGQEELDDLYKEAYSGEETIINNEPITQ